MENRSPKVLVISSVDPSIGPAVVGLEHYQAFKNAGLDVDFLTKYPVEGHPEFISIFDFNPAKPSLFDRVKRKLEYFFHISESFKQLPGYFFFYAKELNPPVSVDRVLKKIQKSYDLVYIVFWQELLSFATISALYDKLHCQFHFQCVDYSPMSGGCHFTGDCLRYQTGCGLCPAICSIKENDFTKWNVTYRSRVYKKVRPIVYGNSYMNRFYRKSFLLGEYDRLETVLPVVDVDKYCPQDPIKCREKYCIGENKTFILLFGSQSLYDERKGISYLLQSLRLFHDKLSSEDRKRVLLVLIGRDIEPIKEQLCFDYLYLGYVKATDLPDIYSMSSVFLSPSVNDAGPSMVNQAMACGTPIIAFEMGTALDVVKGQCTGYCAKLRDAKDFANGINNIFNMLVPEYEALRAHCRDVALELTSPKRLAQDVIRVYNKYNV
ncbi:Glycosyltransferase involved in cell wall bisynthesis [Prevotella sp. khp1]|uniref:glycosyltransferase n=1 Tax=Prevotellaceae TaxID=171552 RepID=UPI00088B7CAE|nr:MULTISPECIES: glycosyltransferase [Prevotellaceae]QVJ81885.1 glycosyltransferase [Xylanibacter ruminicola]SDQ76941.1 Glycosyltransferase involved in cell wall bisynthesis [Prevotella sp. khp1]